MFNLKNNLGKFLFTANIVVSLIPLYLFVIFDRRIWAFDLSYYGIQSLQLTEPLTNLDSKSWWHLLFNQEYSGKAPLMVWILQFPALLLYLNVDVNVIFLVLQVTIASLSVLIGHKIIKEVHSRSNGLFFMYTFLGTTLIHGIAKSNYVENLQFFLILLTIQLYIYFRENNVSKLIYFCMTFALLALVFLVKVNTLIFCWPFFFMIALEYRRTRKTNFQEKILKNSIILFCTFIIIYFASTWYFYNFNDVIKHASQSTSDLWSYNTSFIETSSAVISNLQRNSYALILLVPMAMFAFITRLNKKLSVVDPILKLLVLTIVTSFGYYVLADNSDPRLLYPFYGLTALLLSLIFANSDRTTRVFALAIAFCCFWYVNVATLKSGEKDLGNHTFVLERKFINDLNMKKVVLDSCSDSNKNNQILLTFVSPDLSESAWDFKVLKMRLNAEISKYCNVDSIVNIQGKNLAYETIRNYIETNRYSIFIDATEDWKKTHLYYASWTLNQNNDRIMNYINSKYPQLKIDIYHKEWIVLDVRK